MIFQSKDLRLKTLRIIARNAVNEIQICENTSGKGGGLFTVIFVKDHEIARKFVYINEEANKAGRSSEDVLVETFSAEGGHVIVYPYVKEREISSFYMGSTLTLSECEDICISLIIACMTTGVPWPVLYLMIRQGLINLARDHSVYFSYSVDLTELDPAIGEKECTVECAALLIKLLESKAESKANSYILLQKKVGKRSYDRFTELYKDIRIAAVVKKQGGLLLRIRVWFERNKDTMFRVLLVLCTLLTLFALVSLITALLFGDVPWLRLFIKGFEKIGLESLLQ